MKRALALKAPPIMQKPGGQVTQHYGLDSKSRYVSRGLQSDAHFKLTLQVERSRLSDDDSVGTKHNA